MESKNLLKQNADVQKMKSFIGEHIKPDDIPENFVKKHFKDKEALIKIQKEIELEHGRHIYLCEIVTYLIKYAAKITEKIITIDETPELCESLQMVDDSDHGSDPGYYEGL